MLNFDFLEKGLRIVSPKHFVYNFSRKRFLLYCITWPIILSDFLYFFRYWTICALQLLVSQTLMSHLSQNWCNNCPFYTKEDFLVNFISLIYIYLLCPIILQSLKKKIFRVDPELKACVVLGQNWTKIAYFIKKWIFISIILIYLKKPQEWILRYRLA